MPIKMKSGTNDIKVIAYYLPQFYPFPENDGWWGEGFTEWTNVVKAKPLFKGHYQPKVPADLGYYDLRSADTIRKQVALAKEAGIYAFCLWHYWFGENKVLLGRPLELILENPDIDFKICLGWANESWEAKVWNSGGKSKNKVLMKQEYGGLKDVTAHFHYIKKALGDRRYVRINDRPVFVVYRPLQHPDVVTFMNEFNRLLKEAGIAESFFFIGHTKDDAEIDTIKKLGFDAVNVVRIGPYRYDADVIKKITFKLLRFKMLGRPLVLDYSFVSKYFIKKDIDSRADVFPTLIPNWDHTPRSGRHGSVFHNATPELFGRHVDAAIEATKNKKENILFLKSWNEWGEGNYMEPDRKFGKGFIKVLNDCLKKKNFDESIN